MRSTRLHSRYALRSKRTSHHSLVSRRTLARSRHLARRATQDRSGRRGCSARPGRRASRCHAGRALCPVGGNRAWRRLPWTGLLGSLPGAPDRGRLLRADRGVHPGSKPSARAHQRADIPHAAESCEPWAQSGLEPPQSAERAGCGRGLTGCRDVGKRRHETELYQVRIITRWHASTTIRMLTVQPDLVLVGNKEAEWFSRKMPVATTHVGQRIADRRLHLGILG